jgi:Methyltransferase domain
LRREEAVPGVRAEFDSEQWHERLYQHRFRGVDQSARAAVWGAIAAFLYEELGRPDTVLDPAAGRCEFINAVPARERWAVDRVPFADASIDPGIRFVVDDVMTTDLPAAHFDAALVSNFLEHLPTVWDIAGFLGRLRGWMRPGGRIAVLGPNYRYCKHVYWDCADHTIALTHVSVEEHLHAAGFALHRTVPRFLPYSFRGAFPASPRLTEIYLRSRPAWRLLGKQYLVIAER